MNLSGNKYDWYLFYCGISFYRKVINPVTYLFVNALICHLCSCIKIKDSFFKRSLWNPEMKTMAMITHFFVLFEKNKTTWEYTQCITYYLSENKTMSIYVKSKFLLYHRLNSVTRLKKMSGWWSRYCFVCLWCLCGYQYN